jgi:hypothetical protein
MAAGCLSVVNPCSVILSLHLNTFLRFRLPEDFGSITHNIRKLFPHLAVALG